MFGVRFRHDSLGIKLFGALRFRWARWRLGKAFDVPSGFVGRDTDLLIRGSGRILGTGRLLLIGRNQLYSAGVLRLGLQVSINEYSRILAHQEITIGSHVTIAKFVSILDHDHRLEMQDGRLVDLGYVTAPIRIGSHVLIGDKVTILKGVTIGDNVILAANSVVTRDIPSNCVAAGSPAKPVKSLEPVPCN